ncbi:MAG: tRNA uridine-5-carboxymethylaminomethyl(34) synthesis GTPase MnmE [Candidatus Omnitrophota bacterium]
MNFRIKDYKLEDTIAAPATFASKSALGVVKISGKKALMIISQIFQPRQNKDIRKVKTFTLHYGWIVDRERRMKGEGRRTKNKKTEAIEVVDEVLVSVMRAPGSYTKEDVVEISSHGGSTVLNKILKLVLGRGARLALPGEFTYRAVVKGRIDLLQAEGILGVIEAKSEDSLALAALQLRGEASQKIKALGEELKELFIQSEASINFPEQGLNLYLSNFKKRIRVFNNKVDNLVKGSDQAGIFREGVRCVICGRTNVGKSTLFNRLLKEERVIISKVAGTTRDVIEETINIKGVPLRIYDTAGILEPKDIISKKSLEKTYQAFDRADLVILILDQSRRLSKDDFFLLNKAQGKNTILVINKADLPQKISLKDIPKIKAKIVKISALKNSSLNKFETAIYKSIHCSGIDRENIVFLNQYQRQNLQDLKDELEKIQVFLKQGYTFDFVNLSLKNCMDSLAKLTGEVFSEEILESIFSNFCIGK